MTETDVKKETQKGKTNLFLTNLESLIGKNNMNPTFFAEKTHLTVSFASNLLRGHRAPGLDTLCAIAVAFEIPFEEIAYCLVDKDNISTGKNRKPEVLIYLVNNGRGPTAGTQIYLNEEELEDFYGNKYNAERFLEFVKRYLIDKLYNEKRKATYIERMDFMDEKINAPKSINDSLINDEPFYNIVKELNNMDKSDLLFFKDLINLYKKHHKK